MAIDHLSPSRQIVFEELKSNPDRRYKRSDSALMQLAEQHEYGPGTFGQSLVELEHRGFISKEQIGREVLYFCPGERSDSAVHRFTVTYERGEDGYFIASVPALPGCHSQGRTRDEAKRNIREAARGYVASLQHRGEQVPQEIDSEQIEVTL